MAAQPAHLQPADAALDTTIDALPDQLLGLVLAAAGEEAWPAAALTSRRWHRVLYKDAPISWNWLLIEPVPWPIGEAKAKAAVQLLGKVALLLRIGRRVQHATFLASYSLLGEALHAAGWGLAGMLGMLHPAALRSLDLRWASPLSPAAARLLGSFTRLARLSMDVRKCSASSVVEIACLESLELAECDHMAHLPPVLADATSLRSLRLPGGEDGTFELTDEAADLLLGLPHLAVLGLPLERVPDRVVDRLEQARPELEIEAV
ncbi:hypothetical protein ABPG75_001451 [Micractinium tetrahymenae]